jgi:hypothetical protein
MVIILYNKQPLYLDGLQQKHLVPLQGFKVSLGPSCGLSLDFSMFFFFFLYSFKDPSKRNMVFSQNRSEELASDDSKVSTTKWHKS